VPLVNAWNDEQKVKANEEVRGMMRERMIG